MDEIQYIVTKTVETFEPNTLKIIATTLLTVLFFLFGNLYTEALMAILILMIIDTLFALMAAYHNGQPITSRRFSRSLFKAIVYFMAISAGYFADLTIPFSVIQATMIAFVGATEFISILENMGRMGYKTPKKLLNQLQEFQSKK